MGQRLLGSYLRRMITAAARSCREMELWRSRRNLRTKRVGCWPLNRVASPSDVRRSFWLRDKWQQPRRGTFSASILSKRSLHYKNQCRRRGRHSIFLHRNLSNRLNKSSCYRIQSFQVGIEEDYSEHRMALKRPLLLRTSNLRTSKKVETTCWKVLTVNSN